MAGVTARRMAMAVNRRKLTGPRAEMVNARLAPICERDAMEPVVPPGRLSGHSQGAIAMVEERVTEVETPSGNTHTHTTVVSDGERSGGGATWLIVLLLIIVAAVAIYFFSGMSGSEMAKDNAVAEAANDVGNAANQVGDAAQDAADSVTN
jgi:hypothetical protein